MKGDNIMKFRASVVIFVLLLCNSAFAADNSYIFGRTSNGHYTNQTLGVKAYFSENWRVLSREEIAQLYGISSPNPKSFTNGEMPFFYAMSNEGLAHVMILLANLGVMGNAVSSKESDKILNREIDQFSKSFVDSFKEAGMTEVKIKRATQSFAGKKYPGFTISAKMQGVDVHAKGVLCHKGEYLYCVLPMSLGSDITDALFGMFRRTAAR